MMKHIRHWLIPALALASVAAVQGAELAVRVGGDVEAPGEWTAARLVRDLSGKAETVRYMMKGEAHTARCVPLLALIESARPRFDTRQKNHRVGFVAIVRAADGYTASFSLAELSPDEGDRKVWIALDLDGKPLPESEGPVRLLIPGEGKGHFRRWTFGVRSVTILDGAKLAPSS